MTFERIARRPEALAAGALALALLAAYALAVVDAAYALPPVHLAAAFARGSLLGEPAALFASRAALAAAFTLALAFAAVAGDPTALGRASSTPWRRLALVLGPLLLAPAALAQDDLLRRASITALCVGLAVAFAARMWPSSPAPEGPGVKPLEDHLPALAVVALHAVAFTWLTVERDRALWSATVDLGIFKEALWHTLHGRMMHSPAVGYSFLGEHFSPVLFLLVPLYALWPTSACLLTAQALAVSASGWLVYRLARELGLARPLATALCAAMLFSPPMHTALLYDFHMDLLAAPALAGLALALHRRRWAHAAAALALLVSVKEDMFIPGVAFLLARALTGDREDVKRSLALAAAAAAYGLLAMLVLLKRFGPPPGVPVYMGDPSLPPGTYKFLRNFRHLQGRGGPVLPLLRQPVRFALYALTDARLTTLLGFLLPLGLLPLAAGRRVVLLAPLGVVLLSDNAEIVALHYHYSAVQHPGVFLAAAYGAAAVVGRSADPARTSRALAAFVLAGAAVPLGMHPASVWSRVRGSDARAHTPHVEAVDRLVERLPADAKVTTTTFVGARVSNRPWGHFFPNGIDRADWALVDLQRPPWPVETGLRDEFLRGLMRRGWGAVAWEDGAVLLRRGGDASLNRDALRDLFVRRRYEVEGTEWTAFPGCSVADAEASDGRARVVRPDDPRPEGFVVAGPGLRLMRGRYRVTFRLRAEDPYGRRAPLGEVDVASRGESRLARRELTARDFPDGRWRDVALDFEVTTPSVDGVEFRVRTAKAWLLGADVIALASPDEAAVLEQLLTR